MSAASPTAAANGRMAAAFASDENRPILIACGCIVLILLIGTAYTLYTQGTASFLSPRYLLQQLQVGAFLGLVAAGMMLVILMGHIDLSVPWTIATAAMMATAIGGPWALPVGIGIGLTVGLVNGLGAAYLRVPSMIFTLGVNAVLRGLMVMHTGGFAPQSHSTPLMEFLAVGRVFGIPMALVVWIGVSVLLIVMLQRTPLGRYIYAVGNREAAAYLSGVNTRLVLVAAFMLCSTCAALAGVLLAGYSTKAYQGMGDAYLLPAIAAVVIGGTNILGGQGRYLGTVVGTILIVLLTSVLSIMQMPEAGRQIIYGLVIILMLLAYGRQARVTS
jgi:ribose transport system permease protein